MKKLKHLKTFEGLNYAEDAGLYDKMSGLLSQASSLYDEFSGEDYDFTPEEAIESLEEIPSDHELYNTAQDLIDEIETVETEIDEADSEEYHDMDGSGFDDEVECPDCEGVGGDCERCDGYGRVPRPDDIPPD